MDALQAEKEFSSNGEVKRGSTGKINPEIRLKEVAGQWVQGVLLRNEVQKTMYGNKRVIEIRVSATNVKEASIKDKDKSVSKFPVELGKVYAIWTFTNLDNAVKDLRVGTEVHITYQGVPNPDRKAGQGNPHQVKVLFKEPVGVSTDDDL